MSSRRYSRFSREGWYYLLVLSFVILVAVLRHINLLFILVGLLVGPLIFNWRLVVASLRQIDVRRKLPRRICAGDPLTVDLTVFNRRRRLDSWALVVNDSITLEGSTAKDQRTQVEILLPHVAVGGSDHVAYRAQLTRRGKYRIGPAKICSRFPFGLVTASCESDDSDSLIVCPRLGHLTRYWTRLLEADRAGSHRSQRRRGLMEGEFHGLREWRNGDSQRWIHWRTSAKLNEPTIRQFEQPRNHDLAIILDLWQDETADQVQRDRVELAVSFAATAVSDLCHRGGSRLTAAFVGQDGECRSSSASLVFMQELLERLAVLQAGPCRQLSDFLKEAFQQTSRGTPMVVVSTRPMDEQTLCDELSLDQQQAAELLNRLTWIDASGEEWSRWFHLDGREPLVVDREEVGT